jgi:hypothetical protein
VAATLWASKVYESRLPIRDDGVQVRLVLGSRLRNRVRRREEPRKLPVTASSYGRLAVACNEQLCADAEPYPGGVSQLHVYSRAQCYGRTPIAGPQKGRIPKGIMASQGTQKTRITAFICRKW